MPATKRQPLICEIYRLDMRIHEMYPMYILNEIGSGSRAYPKFFWKTILS